MKYFGLIFSAIFFLVSCGKSSHPKEVYESYILEVQKIESFLSFRFHHISQKEHRGMLLRKWIVWE